MNCCSRKSGLKFTVVPSTFEENLVVSSFAHPADYASATARHKAEQVAYQSRKGDEVNPHIVIGADTIVVVDKEIIGKPKDKSDAINILKKLSDRDHQVITGVVLYHRYKEEDDYTKDCYHVETTVKMGKLNEHIIQAYVDSGEPMGKAGAYAIQESGGSLIKSISGDYYNIVGFPLYPFCDWLYKKYSDDKLKV